MLDVRAETGDHIVLHRVPNMIICDSRQFVFIHNPKCAGTSVRSALQPYDSTGLLFARHDTWNGYKVETTHLPLFMMQVAYPTYFEKYSQYQ